MSYVEDENVNHILDEDGIKMEYTIKYEDVDYDYIHREPIHVDENGDLHTENRNIVIKKSSKPTHAVNKSELDSIQIILTVSINGLKNYVDSKLPNEEAHDDKLEALKNLLLGEIAKVQEEIKEITNDIQDDLNYMNQSKADKTELTKTSKS